MTLLPNMYVSFRQFCICTYLYNCDIIKAY
nr:MAG TPA: hypothetical protein [Caudoviricetes sp.]